MGCQQEVFTPQAALLLCGGMLKCTSPLTVRLYLHKQKHAAPSLPPSLLPSHPVILLVDPKQAIDTVVTYKRSAGQYGVPVVQPEHSAVLNNLWGTEYCSQARKKEHGKSTYSHKLLIALSEALRLT